MQDILFTMGDVTVTVAAALIAFGALALILLLSIAIVIARGGRANESAAAAQVMRTQELELRLADMLRAQSETSGRMQEMGAALAGRQSDMARAVS